MAIAAPSLKAQGSDEKVEEHIPITGIWIKCTCIGLRIQLPEVKAELCQWLDLGQVIYSLIPTCVVSQAPQVISSDLGDLFTSTV